ncbi:hypothetical protein C1646_750336 [Rhizophagus diaphanus]|nr:hypothetical protein C1646_750336 [Rhizophagus diaphanus] [Rhizophagus sp. MUCL 43196]
MQFQKNTVDEVDGSNFLDLTQDDLLSIQIPLGPAKGIEKVINEIKGEQPVAGFSKEPTGLMHVFIDNSNVEIEGKKLISKLENVFEDQLWIDYGEIIQKKVDSELSASICDAIQEHKSVLVAGDGDYITYPLGMSYQLEHIDAPHHPDFPDLQTIILNLDPYYLRFIYAYGRVRKKYFSR